MLLQLLNAVGGL